MVLACAVVASLSWGLGFYGLSVYLAVLNRLHGWSPALISAATTGYYLASGLLGGCRRDRRLWGPRAVLVYGALAMGASLAALGRIRAPWELFAVYLLLATAWASLSGTVITATVVPWFQRRQRLAVTLALTGAGVGGMVLVPALVHATQRFGFPAAMAGAGGLGVAFALMAAHPSAAAFVTGSVIRA